jgi:hypothetical protein
LPFALTISLAFGLAALLPSCRRRCQAGRRFRNSAVLPLPPHCCQVAAAAAAITFVFIIIIVTVIIPISVADDAAAFS